jgi:uncharacterized phage-associated protein
MPTKLSVQDIANYFLTLNDPEAGDFISNLKLQKLCYYAQGFHLAIYGEPLFLENIEAWQHGPVIESLYHTYKEFGSDAIPVPENFDLSIFSKEVRELLDEVYKVYGQFSAWKLRSLTHEEAPWKDAFERGATTITHESMRDYFKTLVNNEN